MFGNRLKKLRNDAGYTIKELSEQLSLKERTYYSYENNEREPDSEILVKIALLFNTSGKNKIFEREPRTMRVFVPNQKAVKPVSVPVIENGIDEEIVAVISAAVAAMSSGSGKKIALKSVKYAKPSRPIWANAGIAENTRPF